MKNVKFYCMMAGTLFSALACNRQSTAITYPETHQDTVTDTYFGTEVPDPYRWMENDTTPEVEAWVKAENEITQQYLAKIPFNCNFNLCVRLALKF